MNISKGLFIWGDPARFSGLVSFVFKLLERKNKRNQLAKPGWLASYKQAQRIIFHFPTASVVVYMIAQPCKISKVSYLFPSRGKSDIRVKTGIPNLPVRNVLICNFLSSLFCCCCCCCFSLFSFSTWPSCFHVRWDPGNSACFPLKNA